MKTKTHIVLVLFSLGFYFISCEGDSNNPNTFEGKLISHSTCKTNFKTGTEEALTADTLSCVEYYFDGLGQKLNIKHINAGFNCCPGDLYCTVSLTADTIIIREFESESECRCNCLFDLDIEVKGVERKKYQMKFIEPYDENMASLVFEIDLTKEKEGSYCVSRYRYPWGTSSQE